MTEVTIKHTSYGVDDCELGTHTVIINSQWAIDAIVDAVTSFFKSVQSTQDYDFKDTDNMIIDLAEDMGSMDMSVLCSIWQEHKQYMLRNAIKSGESSGSDWAVVLREVAERMNDE